MASGRRSLHVQSAKGRVLPFAGPSACTAPTQLVYEVTSFLSKLEMEDDAGGRAQIILRLTSSGDFRKARREVLDFQRTQAEAVTNAVIKAAADRRGESIVRVRGVKQIGITVRGAEKCFREGMNAPYVAQINARAKEIRRGRAAGAGIKKVQVGVAAEISDGAQPRTELVIDRCASAIEAEAVGPGGAGIGPHIRIAGENINF